jgi:hypothetical protein
MRRGDYNAACPKLVESQRIDPSNGTLLNLVLCEERLGKVASAWLHARELLDRLSPNDDRRPIVERRITGLSARLPKLTVRLSPVAPPNTKLILDGVELSTASLGIALPIDPGVHRVVASAAGRQDRATDISVGEAGEYEFSGEPGPTEEPRADVVRPPSEQQELVPSPLNASVTSAGPPDTPPFQSVHSSGPVPRWVGWTAGGVGATGLLTGAVLGVMALQKLATVHETCPDKQCRDSSGLEAAHQGKQLLVGSIVGLSVGAVGLGFGIYVLTRSDAAAPSASGPPAHPAPSGALVTYGAAF